MVEMDKNLILHFEVVDKREVGLKSPNMERKGMIRALDFLTSRVTVDELITDASTSVHKTLGMCSAVRIHMENFICRIATKYPSIHHSYDIWHKSKKLQKALTEVRNIRQCKQCLWKVLPILAVWKC